MDKYFNVQFRIDSGYEWGKGMSEHKTKLFYSNIILAFVRKGWTVQPIEHSNCVYLIKEKTKLYVHPMELTGVCKECHLEEVKSILISDCGTCKLETVKVMEEVKEQGSEELIKSTVDKICSKYIKESEVCMAEYLASEKVCPDLTYENAFYVYVRCMKKVEGDRFYIDKEGIIEEIKN